MKAPVRRGDPPGPARGVVNTGPTFASSAARHDARVAAKPVADDRLGARVP
jgi:hypothetical protein